MKKLLLGLTFTIVFFLGTYPTFVHALTISPVKIELEAEPGQTIGGIFELHNEESIPRTLYVSYENFEPSGDLGTPRFIGRDGGLATWTTATPEIVLEPDTRVSIPYSIVVPADAKPGGYFAAIFYGGQNPNASTGGEVAIGGKLGILLLLRVQGEITEEGGINRFEGAGGKRLIASVPVTFTVQMTNRGGDRITPQGGVTVKNIFGFEVTRLEVNANQGSILPNSSRTFSVEWQGTDMSTSTSFANQVARQWANFRFGIYKSEVSLVWGADKNVSTATYWLVIVPWQLLVIVSAAALGLYFLVRRYNRFIIAKAKRS